MCYTLALSSCLRARQLGPANTLLYHMGLHHVQPDRLTYRELARACLHHAPQGRQQLWSFLLHQVLLGSQPCTADLSPHHASQ